MRPLEGIVIHCSATGPKMDVGYEEIKRWHTLPKPHGNGWDDIGYHFVIRRDGTLEEGRPLHKRGIHAGKYNRGTVAICLVGGVGIDRVTPDDNFTEKQYDALEQLIIGIRAQYESIAWVKGHGELPGVTKACPSFSVPVFLKYRGMEA